MIGLNTKLIALAAAASVVAALLLTIGYYKNAYDRMTLKRDTLQTSLTQAGQKIQARDTTIRELRDSIDVQNASIKTLGEQKARVDDALEEVYSRNYARKKVTTTKVTQIGQETAALTTAEEAIGYLKTKAPQLVEGW